MYLAEAIKEKVFIHESITDLSSRIKELSVSADDTDVKLNKELVKNKVKELENLYKEWQRYAIIIARAKTVSKIKLNDEDFSIADAEKFLDSMRAKLDFLKNLNNHVDKFSLTPQNFTCVDLEDIHDKIRNLLADIRAVESSIERSLWSIEV